MIYSQIEQIEKERKTYVLNWIIEDNYQTLNLIGTGGSSNVFKVRGVASLFDPQNYFIKSI